MEILITNDDGYQAKGLRVLTDIMKSLGNVTVIAPKTHQSGMSTAVSLGLKQLAYKKLQESTEESWSYLDATPASCVKFGLNTKFEEKHPDLLVSGINHGSNAATASCYSGTLGAAEEGALNGILSVGVSLTELSPDADFSVVEEFLPNILKKILELGPASKPGIFYNINFPNISPKEVKGIKVGYQGMGKWVREFRPWSADIYAHYGITPEMLGLSGEPEHEEGEELYMMVGEFVDDPRNNELADHRLLKNGYISIVAHNMYNTDEAESSRLRSAGFDIDF